MAQFDPTAKGKLNYLQSGMTARDYNVMRSSWLKQQAANEGREYKPGYVPEGYVRVYSSPRAEGLQGRAKHFTETWNYRTQDGKPTTTLYWKPEAYAKYREDMAAVPWDITKKYQNYWHNPANVVSWTNRLRVQDEGYQPPDWLDTDFLESQYDALKHFNGDEEDPFYWKPLPFGSEEAFLTNYVPDPNGSIPIYDAILEDQTKYENAFAGIQKSIAAAQSIYDMQLKQEQQKIIDWQADVNTDDSAESVLTKLQQGADLKYIEQKTVDDYKTYAQEQGLIPLEDGSFMSAANLQPEGGDYLNLYPWQRFVQTIGGQVAMQNQPEYSKNIGAVVGAGMPALGVWGMSNMLGTAAVATATASKLIVGKAAATALAASTATVLGLPVATAIGVGAVVLGAGTLLYLLANKDNPNNTVVQKIFRIMNVGAEIPERAIGAVTIASNLAAEGKEVDWSAAYDAGYMTYEMTQPGNFLLNFASLASQWVENVGSFFGIEKDLSSGETAGEGEVWQLSQGYADPVQAEIPLGTEGLLVSYEQMKALGDDRTRDEMETEWAYLTSLTGTGGTISDFMAQSLIDVSNFIPAVTDKGMETYATSMAKKAQIAGDSVASTAWTQMALSARGAIGNLAVDALPMGVQQLTERVLKGWDSRLAWMEDVKYQKTVLDYRVWKNLDVNKARSISKWARGSQGLPDALNNYMAKMTTGYQMPGSNRFTITPGGRVRDTISLEPGSDGSLMVYNIDGTESWSYTPEQLSELDIKLFTNKDGNLTITGVKKLLTDIGVSTDFTFDALDTTLTWDKPVDPNTGRIIEPDIIDVANVEYSNSEDPTTYIAKVDNKTYTVDRTTDYVQKVVNENGDIVPLDKVTRMSEHPVFLEGEILKADEAQALHDYIVLRGNEYRRYVPIDFKPASELDTEGLRGYLQGLDIPIVNKIIDAAFSLSDLTPGSKAMIEAMNVQQSLELMYFFSGNNFVLTMNALKKVVGGIDIGRTAKAAETFIGSGSMTAAVAAALKSAWGDGSLIDTFIELYNDTMVDRATLAKIGAQIDVLPEKLVTMKAEDIFAKLKNKVIAKNDDVSRQIMQMMSDGTLSAKTLDDILKKFTGKAASPVTDEGFLASVMMLTDKNVQDFLIEKYGVKKLDTWSRLSSMKKAMLSPFLIAFPYTTWMNNLYSNLGAQFFLTGGTPFHSKSGIEKLAAAIGLENMPAEYGRRMGLASDTLDIANKISLTMNPMDSMGKITRKIRNFGGAIKAYSAIEKFNSASLFVQEVLNQHRRLPLPEFPVNLKNKLLSAGYTEQQLGYIKHFLNRQLGVEGINQLIKGTTYDAIDAGLFQDVGKLLFPDDPQNADLYQQFAEKLFDNEDFIEAIKGVEPDNLSGLREALITSLENQIDTMMVSNAISTIGEVQNIVSKEGMAGGINVFAQMLAMEMKTRSVNSERWGEAMANYNLAKQKKDYALAQHIIRLRRSDASRMFDRSGTRIAALAKGLVDALKPGDDNAKRFLDLIADRSKRGSDLMDRINRNYQDYLDITDNDVFTTYDDVIKRNAKLMDEYDALETESLTRLGDLFVEMLGKPDAGKGLPAGLTVAELQAGGKKLMKTMVDGFNDLNKKRKAHYEGIEKLSGNERIASNLMFWNTDYQPALNAILSNFIDGNWQEFFKTKTDLEKALYPDSTLVGEAIPKKKATTSPLSEAENELINTLSKAELDDNNRAILEAAKARSDAIHIRAAWLDDLLKTVDATPDQIAIVDALMDSYDAYYSKRTGKPAGSWWSDTMKIGVTQSGEYELKFTGSTRTASAITRYNLAQDMYEIVVATNNNFSTALRELTRVVFHSDLLPDIDKAIIAREYGDMSLETFTELNNQVMSGVKLSDEALKSWRAVHDGFADSLRKWWANEARQAAPPEMRPIFSNLTYFLFKFIEKLKSRLSKVKLSPAVKEMFEVMHGFKDMEDRIDRNVGRLAEAPAGNPRVMNKILVREVRLSSKGQRQTAAIGVGADVPAGLVDTIELLNAGGFRTYKSSSGLTTDNPDVNRKWQPIETSYISFRTEDLTAYRIGRIREVAKELGVEYLYIDRDGVKTIEISPPPKTMNYLQTKNHDAEIVKFWEDFTDKLIKKMDIPEIEGRTFQATPKVVPIGNLIGALSFDSGTGRVSINKNFDSSRYEIPPSKYTTKQLRALARELDIDNLLIEERYSALKAELTTLEGDVIREGEEPTPGLKKKEITPILVDPDGMVVSGSETLLALLYAKMREPGIFERYNATLHRQGYNWGFAKNALNDIQDGILVFQVDKGFDRRLQLVGDVIPEAPFESRTVDMTRRIDDFQDKIAPYLHDTSLLEGTLVTPESVLDDLTVLRRESLDIANQLLKLREEGKAESLDSDLIRLQQDTTKLEAQIKSIEDIIGKRDGMTPGLAQTSDEISGQSWYYYKSRKLVEGLKQNIFAPDQLRAAFRQAKQSEYRLLEIDALLDSAEKITKDDALAWIDAHSLDIEEVPYDSVSGTRYEQVTLPGGENYRELLITVPNWTKEFQSGHWIPKNVLAHIRFDVRIDPSTGFKVLNLLEIQSDWIQKGKYGFRGDPEAKIIAKATEYVDNLTFKRVSSDIIEDPPAWGYHFRRGTDYSKISLSIYENIDETGAAYYTIGDLPIEYPTLDMAKDALRNSLIDSRADMLRYERPAQPPLTKYGLLAMKRMLRYAVDEGFDSISFSTGATAAEIEGMPILENTTRLIYNENDWLLTVESKDETVHDFWLDMDEFTLAKHVGDDLAQQLMKQPVDAKGLRTLDFTEPIEFGGEKMKWWYDDELVNDLNGYLKQWGIKIEDGEIQAGREYKVPAGTLPIPRDEMISAARWYSWADEDINQNRPSTPTELIMVNRITGNARIISITELGVEDAGDYVYDPSIDFYELTSADIQSVTRPVHKVVFNDKLKGDVIQGQPLMQPADEIPLPPITERPAGSEPVHMNTGGGLSEMMEYDVPTVVDKMMEILAQRLEASKRQDYMIDIPEGGDQPLQDLLAWAREQQRLRMATVMEGANRVTKDIMIDYSRRRGIDQYAEIVFPFQFWYTRSLAMWMKRMVSKPSVMAMAYRYMELRRRNEMTGYPTRLGGKSPVYAPWLPESMGDWMFINPWNKFYTPEQLFQPIQNFASLDAEVAKEAQAYIQGLMEQGTISPEAARAAIVDKKGTIWDDAVQYTRANSMKNETDPLTMASMFVGLDPMMNALYQSLRGTPEQISPLPLTRLGNSFEAIGGDGVLGLLGAMLSYPEDKLREVAGLPQAGEYTDYYVDFALSNMSTEGKYSIDEIKQAMISRQGQAFEEATLWAQQYLALRTPGTAFANAIVSGVRKPDDLASAFLMSFFPSGLFPEGEMELRGLRDEYQQAWKDYERGDPEAIEKFNEKYPEYQTRMMMFKEPEERLRAHLINIIWETYTAMPTANQQIAADSLGASFKAYFLDNKTRDYDKIDEKTLTTWARKLGYQAPALPGVTEQAASETIDPLSLYPEDTAAIIQTFIDERKTRFPDYYIYQSVYFRLPKEKQDAFLEKFPIVEDYWDWKKAYTDANPTIKSYLESRADSAGNSDTEYDVEAVHNQLLSFDSQLLEDVLYYQTTGERMSTGTKDALLALFKLSGSPGGDFNLWLDVVLGE